LLPGLLLLRRHFPVVLLEGVHGPALLSVSFGNERGEDARWVCERLLDFLPVVLVHDSGVFQAQREKKRDF